MIFLISVLISIGFFLAFTKEAKAIIVVVPVVLIPIVSFVVWVIGALATPIIAFSAFYFKIKKKSIFFGIFFGLVVVLVIGVIIALIFKLVDPQRPFFH